MGGTDAKRTKTRPRGRGDRSRGRTPGKRPRDHIFETCVELFYPRGLPEQFRAGLNATVRDLKNMDVTPAEIRKVYALAEAEGKRKDVNFTAPPGRALVNHFCRFLRQVSADKAEKMGDQWGKRYRRDLARLRASLSAEGKSVDGLTEEVQAGWILFHVKADEIHNVELYRREYRRLRRDSGSFADAFDRAADKYAALFRERIC